MQFQYNSDYPGLVIGGQHSSPDGMPVITAALDADPIDFPPARPIQCARITTRIYHPSKNNVTTVQNVLVRSMMRQGGGGAGGGGDGRNDRSYSSSMSSDDSFSSSDESDMMMDDPDSNAPTTAGGLLAMSQPQQQLQQLQLQQGTEGEDRAYWIQRTIREAIYGKVLFAVVLRRRQQQFDNSGGLCADWEVTSEYCAVKEMSWQHITQKKDRLAEDPIKEVSAMQYLKNYYDKKMQLLAASAAASGNPVLTDGVMESFQAIADTNIMMPLDLLTDDRNLYSIMPYCDGGELFERLDLNERFSEEEARYWMDQILRGIETLQSAGVCHRDMSLENLLVHKSGALIIDLGMCLRVPFVSDVNNQNSAELLSSSLQNMNVNGGASNPLASVHDDNICVSGRSRPRCLIRPQGTCGKWIYMSPEVYKNGEPFDGYAVDMWAAGVILFLMLTGFPPWERACATDERFKYMTAGYLVQMLSEWELGISSDAMDLLQRMLWLDPKDRLSLDQVRAHPWMCNGRRAPPQGGMF